MLGAIDHLVLVVCDIERSLGFYRDVLDVPVRRAGGRGRPGASGYFRDPDGNRLEIMSYEDAG